MYIMFCKCNRRILTTGQIKENQPCEICQKEKQHAQGFQDRLKEAQKEGEKND